MKSIKEAARICRELEAATKGGTKKVAWTDLYTSEEELFADLRKVEIPANGEAPSVGFTPLYTGYEYIHSFAKRLQAGGSLTEKQVTMAKRLALQIRKAAAIA